MLFLRFSFFVAGYGGGGGGGNGNFGGNLSQIDFSNQTLVDFEKVSESVLYSKKNVLNLRR